MRYHQIINETFEDEEYYDLSMEEVLERLPKQTVVLPAGTALYHGTNIHENPKWHWDPRKIDTPAWFAPDAAQATRYAFNMNDGPDVTPHLLAYKTTRPLKLLDIGLPEMKEPLGQYWEEGTPHDLAHAVLELGFDGWYSKDDEVMIGDASDVAFLSSTPLR